MPSCFPARSLARPPAHRRAIALSVALGCLAALLTSAPPTASAGPAAYAERRTLTPDLRSATAGRGPLTAAAKAEIRRVMAEIDGPPLSSRIAPAALAEQTVRCATFEGQRYCLGVGWTTSQPRATQARMAKAATTEAVAGRRGTPTESTGDRSALATLRYRAGLPPEERARIERRELRAAARSVAKVWLLRHQIQGTPLPDGFLEAHPEVSVRPEVAARGATTTRANARSSDTVKTAIDYPPMAKMLSRRRVNDQRRTYWCGPTTMQMIAWNRWNPVRYQSYWARRLRTTSSGTNITDMVRVINNRTNWDRPERAGKYIVLDIADFSYRQWVMLIRRHIVDYRAPLVLHPVLLKEYYPYLDDDGSGHYQVGRGYDNNGAKMTAISFFEPWNQQRFDPSEPYIERVQWRYAYKSYRANKAHFLHNIGV
ncbi:MAG: C39 family peptidase [Nocardioides sp.]